MNYLPEEKFKEIYSQVPRLSVDVLLQDKNGDFLMTRRAISPRKGYWHTAGGTVLKGESVLQAVKRICYKELGFHPTVVSSIPRGIVEIIEPFEHTVSCFMECKISEKEKISIDGQADDYAFFEKGNFPVKSISQQVKFLESLRE
jgi:ADP-ribose pyrophosphatase YjhB (NUDIX family)